MGKSGAVVLITRIAPETGTRGGRVVMFRPTHPIKPHQSGRDGSGRLDIKKKKKQLIQHHFFASHIRISSLSWLLGP